jgi:hypothetical protein
VQIDQWIVIRWIRYKWPKIPTGKYGQVQLVRQHDEKGVERRLPIAKN